MVATNNKLLYYAALRQWIERMVRLEREIQRFEEWQRGESQ